MHTLEQALEFNVDNLFDSLEVELVEGDNLVQTVEKLWCELLAKTLLNDSTSTLLVAFILWKSVQIGRFEAHTLSKFFQLTCTRIWCHDDYRVAEVYQTTVAISQSTFIKYL